MKSAIAVLTYRRAHALQNFLAGVKAHAPGYPVAVFEDCGSLDDTEGMLAVGPSVYDRELEADVYDHGWFTAFVGRRNLGVSGNSNRALRWFERQATNGEATPDHLLLCNDDLSVSGDFAAEYAAAHTALKIGLLSFCDFTSDEYAGPTVKVSGIECRLIMRMTGMMFSMTRAVLNRIGYFDTIYGRFGQEHCCYQNRARLAGFSDLRGKPQQQVDIVSRTLKSNPVESSIMPAERPELDHVSWEGISLAAARYQTETWYRPFCLQHGQKAGSYGGTGIPVRLLKDVSYTLVVDHEVATPYATP